MARAMGPPPLLPLCQMPPPLLLPLDPLLLLFPLLLPLRARSARPRCVATNEALQAVSTARQGPGVGKRGGGAGVVGPCYKIIRITKIKVTQ